MRIIQFLSEPFWQQLGLTLVHFLWQGLAVAVLAAAIVRVFRLGPGHLRYGVYLIAFALLAGCPLLTLVTINRLAVTEIALPEPMVVSSAPAGIEMVEPLPGGDAEVRPGVAVRPAPGDGTRASARGRLEVWLPWAVAFWMVGVVLLSVRLLLGYVGIWRWRRGLRPLPEALAGRVARLSSRMGMPQFSCVFLSPAVRQATAVGYLRPMVLLPASMLTQMDPAMIEAVVAHELAHIRRLDLWVNLAQRIVETLLFYHPAVWWLSGRLRAEREFCCDEMAVAATGERLAYASALETAQRGRLAVAQPTLALTLGQGRRSTLSRVRHILGLPPVPADSRFWLAGAIVVAILAILALPAASLLTAQADENTTSTDQAQVFELLDAAARGDIEQVKTLLAAGADVNARDRDDTTALQLAAREGHLEVVTLLVAHGADVNGGEQAGWTPLLAAASTGHEDIVEFLLKKQADVDGADVTGYTPLYYAIWVDDEETVKTLIGRGADVNKTRPDDYSPLVYAVWQRHTGNTKALIEAGADLNHKDRNGWTPLYWVIDEGDPATIRLFLETDVEMSDLHRAVLEGDLANVKRLIDSGMDVDTQDAVGRPLSHWALSAGQMNILDYLLSEGADVTMAGSHGWTLLHKASAKGLADVVRGLIAKGAPVNARTQHGGTPLFSAAAGGYKEICELLIANGADVNAAKGDGRHPLGDATARGHAEVVRLLLVHGADPNLSVNNRGTALHAAANYSRPALVEILIAAGADVNAASRLGTPLHLAARPGDGIDDEIVGQIVKMLLAHGASVNATNKQSGCTPLHMAAQRGAYAAARLLIAAGADVNARDNQGRTPLSYAEGKYRCRKVAELLRGHGTKDAASTGEADEVKTEALSRAAADGDVDRVKELIAGGADVNAGYGDSQWTPLLAAADGGHERVVKILLDNGADPDQSQGGSYAFTPLHRAIFSDDAEVVEMLIAAGADVNKRPNSEDDPPLFYAVWQCHAAVKPLIDAGADVNAKGVGNDWTPPRHALQWGHGDIARQFIGSGAELSPEQIAVLEGDVARVRQFIESGTDVDSKDEFGWTLTYWALSAGQKDVAEYLLRQGADISARTSDGFTLLHQASQAGFADVVKALLAKGADVNATGLEGRHPLGTAASSGHLEVVRLLLANGSDANATWMNGRHALGDAASNGHKAVVELLIASGADVNLHAGGRGGALHAASQAGHASIVDLLVANGADVNLSAQRGTPLHRAVGCRWQVSGATCARIVGKLIAAGAELDAREPRQGGAPLHIAAQKGRARAAQRLINGGADVNAKDKNGKTPLALAQEQGRTEIVELLRQGGAK